MTETELPVVERMARELCLINEVDPDAKAAWTSPQVQWQDRIPDVERLLACIHEGDRIAPGLVAARA